MKQAGMMPAIISGPRKKFFLGLLMVAVFEALGLFGLTLTIKSFAIFMNTGGASTGLWSIALILTILTLMLMLFHWMALSLSEQLGMHYSGELRLALLASAARATTERRIRLGSTLARMMGDLSAVRDWVANGVAMAMIAPLTLLAGLAGLFVIDMRIGWLLSLSIAIAALLIVPWLKSSLMLHAALLRRMRGKLSARLGDLVLGVASVARFGRVRSESKRLGKQNDALLGASVSRVRRLGAASALAAVIVPATIAGVAWLQWSGERIDLAGVGVWSTLLFSLSLVAGSLMGLVNVLDQYTSFVVARRRIRELLAQGRGQHVLRAGLNRLPKQPLSVEFGGFASLNVVVPDSLRITAKQVVALIGRSGCGKSYLLRMIAIANLNQQDQCVIGGVDIADIEPRSFQRRVQLVSPELPLLRGSACRNLRYAGRGVSDGWLHQVREACGLLQLQERVEQAGSNLSSSQAVRLRLARALVAKPGLLLIDDPLFFYDPEARAALKAASDLWPMTIVVVAPNTALLEGVLGIDQTWCLSMSGGSSEHRCLHVLNAGNQRPEATILSLSVHRT